jgi:hypothetical protein
VVIVLIVIAALSWLGIRYASRLDTERRHPALLAYGSVSSGGGCHLPFA